MVRCRERTDGVRLYTVEATVGPGPIDESLLRSSAKTGCATGYVWAYGRRTCASSIGQARSGWSRAGAGAFEALRALRHHTTPSTIASNSTTASDAALTKIGKDWSAAAFGVAGGRDPSGTPDLGWNDGLDDWIEKSVSTESSRSEELGVLEASTARRLPSTASGAEVEGEVEGVSVVCKGSTGGEGCFHSSTAPVGCLRATVGERVVSAGRVVGWLVDGARVDS